MAESNDPVAGKPGAHLFGYSPVCLDHIKNPRNMEEVPDHNGFDLFDGPCGDLMTMGIDIKDNVVKNIAFQADGCGVSIACGSMTTEMAQGKTTDDLRDITLEKVIAALGGLPEDHAHCALLAVTTLRMALTDYLDNNR
jgi:nitrogen fixation NifU-like protein